MNPELEVLTISNNILDTFGKDKKKLVRQLSKMGFVVVDDVIQQYNPVTHNFGSIDDNEIMQYVNKHISNKWGMNNSAFISMLKNELPRFHLTEISNYRTYVQQSQIIINEDLIESELKRVLSENKELQRLDTDFKGKTNLESQLSILRNHNVFSVPKRARLFRYKDNEFQRYTSHDVVGLFNDVIAIDDIIFNTHAIKNNWRIYVDNLTDVSKLVRELKTKQKKESLMNSYESDYQNVLKYIKTIK